MFDIVIRVVDHRDRLKRLPISAISFLGTGYFIKLPKTDVKRFIKCQECGYYDFREGIAINYYTCDGCGAECQIWHV